MNGRAPHGSGMSADEALALDFALDILVEPLRGIAEARQRSDPDFRRLVHLAQDRLISAEPIDEFPGMEEVSPRPETWTEILLRIGKRERS
ncbi:MAG: hypothetical protein QE280_15350 [Caulobacter sp.]|nr:hypothetical protein [Caulobacter sp.]